MHAFGAALRNLPSPAPQLEGCDKEQKGDAPMNRHTEPTAADMYIHAYEITKRPNSGPDSTNRPRPSSTAARAGLMVSKLHGTSARSRS